MVTFNLINDIIDIIVNYKIAPICLNNERTGMYIELDFSEDCTESYTLYIVLYTVHNIYFSHRILWHLTGGRVNSEG